MANRPEPILTPEALAAADMLLATVGNFGMPHPGEEIAARGGAAYALIAANINARLHQVPDLSPGEMSTAYFRGVGGGIGVTLKVLPATERAVVAVALFFYMLDFLSHAAGQDTTAFVNEFLQRLEDTLDHIEGNA